MKQDERKPNRLAINGILSRLKNKKVRFLTLSICVIICLALGLLLLIHLPPIQKKILSKALTEANSYLTSRLEIKNFRWIPSSSLSFSTVTFSRGKNLIAKIDKVAINYRFQLKWPEFIRINRVTLINPKVYLRKDTTGAWILPGIKKRTSAQTVPDKEEKTVSAEEPWWECLIPRNWIIEEGILKIVASSPGKTGEIKYDFKNINAFLNTSFNLINGQYEAIFTLERASFYQTRPSLGLVVANGHVSLKNAGIQIKDLNVNIGKTFLGLGGKINLIPSFKPFLTLQIQNLTPSKASIFLPSWPLIKDINTKACLNGTDKFIFVTGSASWSNSSLEYSGKLDLTSEKRPEISVKLNARHVNLKELSLPVDSNLNGEIELSWKGSSLHGSTTSVECKLAESSVNSTKIKSGNFALVIEKELFRLTDLNLLTDQGAVKATGYFNTSSDSSGKMLEVAGDISGFNLKPFLKKKDVPGTDLNLSVNLAIMNKPGLKERKSPMWKKFDLTCLIKLRHSSLGKIQVARGILDISTKHGLIDVRKLNVVTEAGYLNSSGTIEPPSNMNIEYDTNITNLSAFAMFVPWKPLKGFLKSTGQITGSFRTPDWKGHLSATGIQIADYGAEKLQMTGESSFSIDHGKRKLKIEATDINIKKRKINRVVLDFRQENGSIDSSASITFNGGNTVLDTVIESLDIFASEKRILLRSLHLANNTTKWSLEDEGVIRLSKAKVTVDRLKLKCHQQAISLLGTINWDETCDLEIILSNINVEQFSRLLGKPIALAGRLDTVCSFKGSLKAPVIEATGEVHKLKVEKVDFKPLSFQAQYTRPKLSWECKLFRAGETQERIYGNFNVDINLKEKKINFPENKVSGEIKAEKIDLSILKEFQPRLEEISGIMDMDISISGSKDSPNIFGTASLLNGNIKMKEWRRSLKSINLTCRLHTRGIDVVRANARWGEGKVHFRGWIPYPFGKSKILDIIAKLDNVTLPDIFGIHSRVDADLYMGGDKHHPKFTGKIKIKKAIVVLDELMSNSESDIEVIDTTDREPAKEKSLPGFGHSFFDKLAMDLDIIVEPGHAWLNGKRLNAELAGNLNVFKKELHPVAIQGKLYIVRGSYNLQGKIFQIVDGTILFNGLSPPDPNLHVVCEYKVKDVHIYTTPKGSLSKMQLELSSDPPMEKVDILAYIFYGHPASELSSKQASNLGDEALALVGNSVARLIKDKILPDSPWVPDVLTYKSGNNEEEGGVVMIGKYITPDLFVDVEKGTSSKVNDQMKIEYRINKHFSIESQIGDEANSGVDFFWRYDFGE